MPNQIAVDPVADCATAESGRRVAKEYVASRPLSARDGVNRHSEHLADTVLDIHPGVEREEFPSLDTFCRFTESFLRSIKAREFELLNEKFDGSIALHLGLNDDGKPYVAYKGWTEGKDGPRLIQTLPQLKRELGKGDFAQTFEDCVRYLRPTLSRFGEEDYVFQADLLFAPSNGASKQVSRDAISIKANPYGITYTVPRDTTFYPFVKRAKLGLVVHTAYKRETEPESGRWRLAPVGDPEIVERFVRCLRSDDVFVIDPWSRQVRLDREGVATLTEDREKLVRRIVHDIDESVRTFSSEFRHAWKPFATEFRTFLNKSLKAGRSGGIYQAAANDELFDFGVLTSKFRAWAEDRADRRVSISISGRVNYAGPRTLHLRFDALMEHHRSELYLLLKAYYDANRIQYLLKPHLGPLYRSKLGRGSEIEGVILGDETALVKLVDRLEFTRMNFAGEASRQQTRIRGRARRRAERASKGQKLETALHRPPFKEWDPDVVFYIGKFQPPHAGHIAVIQRVKEQIGDRPLYVVASDKEPNLSATDWHALKNITLKGTKGALAAGQYTHLFTPELRKQAFEHGLPDGVTFISAPSNVVWQYLKRARDRGEEGKVMYVVGEKEMEQARYQHNFERFGAVVEPLVIDMQAGGVSGTEIRDAIRNLALNRDVGSYNLLSDALSYIPKKDRNLLIRKMLAEWEEVNQVVRDVLGLAG